MKKLLHLQKNFLNAVLFLLFFAGCIKEPGPDIPLPVPKPEWLLAKFIEVTANGDPIFGPVYGEYYHEKRVTAYKYNQYYKPSLQLVYFSVNHGDTINLALVYRDTLCYDRLLRVTEVKTLSNANRVTRSKKLSYQGNDTLPNIVETYFHDSTGNPVLQSSTRYEYWGDTVVLAINSSSKNSNSTKYVYEYGNFTRQCNVIDSVAYCTEKYMNYIGRNVGLFLNISHGLAIEIPDIDPSPLISRGNWQNKQGDADHYRGTTFNEHGLLVRAGWHSSVPEYSISNRFEYMKVE